jgi:RNA polymerase sigma factor (sigma-70 family)
MSEAVASGAGPRVGLPRVLSDERLTRRAVKGDERAFAAIFDRYHQRLYRYCLAIVGDAQDAQDALQNTMVKVLRALPGEERRIELKPWLYRIAHNESIELLRRRRDARELDGELAAPGAGLAAEAASRERLRLLLADLEELPERQRGALVMRELSGLEFAEIGAALGTSAAVARQTLYEARLGLRQMDEGREMSCEAVRRALSDGDGRVSRRRDLRAHLRTCAGCRRFREEIEGRERDFAALSPLPAALAAGLLQGLLGAGGGGATGGAGLAAGLGGGAAKSIGTSAVLKGAAALAVAAAVGVGAADRGGLIELGLPGDGGTPATPAMRAAGNGSAAAPGGHGDRIAPRRLDSGVSASGRQELRDARLAGRGAVTGSGAALNPGVGSSGRGASADTAADPISRSPSSTAHPHGKGHEKQHPSASAHGQQTAATHKAAGHGAAAGSGHPTHPAHPPKPAQPSTPSAEKGPAAPTPAPAATAPGPSPQGQAAAPEAEPPAAPPAHETGKKP